MDDSSIGARTEKLRREIALIQQEERHYRISRSQSLAENAEHEKPSDLVTYMSSFTTSRLSLLKIRHRRQRLRPT
jgi:hypothetical protein